MLPNSASANTSTSTIIDAIILSLLFTIDLNGNGHSVGNIDLPRLGC